MGFRLISILLLSFLLLATNSRAAILSGMVTDEQNSPLSFANVYILGTTIGTTTNEKGKYHIELSKGNHQIVFNYIGYKKHIENVIIGNDDIVLNIVLHQEEIELKEVVVSPTEDPAYPIIRKTIARRQFHFDQVESYHCFVYVKGLQRIVSAPDKVFGQTVNFDGSLDSNNAGIVYLSESMSEYTFEKPDKIKETMISSKVSGNSQGFSWNRIGDLNTFNFYKNSIRLDFLSERVFISPIADNAMLYYKYRLDGVFEEDGLLVNKIEVIPKRENDPVFKGYIYIIEDLWNIHSLEFLLTKENQIKYIDSLTMNMVYVPVDSTLWMPVSQRYDFKFELFKIVARGYFNIIYKDYTVNKDYSNKMFTNEVLNINEESNKKDEEYWNANRPVPLTEEEISDYARKDSLEELKKSKEYLRTLDRKANKFTALDVVLGYNYQNSYRKFDVQFNPLLDWVQYNTVEGFNLRLKAEITKEFDRKREFSVEPALRYGFSNNRWQTTLRTSYYYDPKRDAAITLHFGQYIFQFNRGEAMNELGNTFYTLFLERNYMKIFRERFITVRHKTEIANGLMLWTSLNYERRSALENIDSPLRVKNRKGIEFEENVPGHESQINGSGDYEPFKEHDAFIISLSMRWRPAQKYVSRPYTKIEIGSKYPDFTLFYKKSIPGVIKSDLNFDFLEFKISDEIPMKLFGNSTYSVKLGMFVNDNNVEFMDYKHFYGNKTIFGQHFFDGFQLLDYYVASTTNKYVELHFQHNFEGALFNKIPGVRKTKFQELVGVHFFYSEDFGDYTELDIGIENILRVIRVDFVMGFKSHESSSFGFRVGIDFNQF